MSETHSGDKAIAQLWLSFREHLARRVTPNRDDAVPAFDAEIEIRQLGNDRRDAHASLF